MAGFTKLFSDIVDSSIWDEDAETCKVWVTLLALSDSDGYVRGSVGWLASKAKVRSEQCAIALKKFESEDPSSRTTEHEGRRIETLDDGWLVLNYLLFRDRLSNDVKASKTRERVKKHRQLYQTLRNISSVTPKCSASASASVSVSGTGTGGVGEPQHEYFDPFGHEIPIHFRQPNFLQTLNEWHEYKGQRRETYKPVGARNCLSKLLSMGTPEIAIQSLKEAMSNNWQGFFLPKTNHSNGNGKYREFVPPALPGQF